MKPAVMIALSLVVLAGALARAENVRLGNEAVETANIGERGPQNATAGSGTGRAPFAVTSRSQDHGQHAPWRSAQREPQGMRFEVFIRLKQGMTEAELVQRAGPPDYEAVEGTDTSAQALLQDSVVVDPATGNAVPQKNVIRSERTEVVKSWYYLPTVSDPYTTHVTLIGGRIARLERTKKF